MSPSREHMPESADEEAVSAEGTVAAETAEERVSRAVRDLAGQGARVQIIDATPRICLVLLPEGSTTDLFTPPPAGTGRS